MSPTDATLTNNTITEGDIALCGGTYDVKEDGIKFRHISDPPILKDGNEFISLLKSNFRFRVLENPDPSELVFELINVDVSFANALRRIMIAEVPTVAIEHVYMWNNSSIIHDEILAHRIGLVPLMTDPRLFEEFSADDDEATDRNTVVFRLGATCPSSKKAQQKMREERESKESEGDSVQRDNNAAEATAKETATNAAFSRRSGVETAGRPFTHHVYSGDLKWMPQGDQKSRFGPRGIRPIHEDILLAKLRPGQVIELEAHGRLGMGKDHAKYSPVATACYRLMPKIELLQPVYDEKADELDLYEPGVFKIVPCDENGHTKKAVVSNPYACTMSRNFMRDPFLKDAVKITRLANHFIFSVESVGMLPASVIVAESLRVLRDKCSNVIRLADDTMGDEGME